jgi:hypothetical protein
MIKELLEKAFFLAGNGLSIFYTQEEIKHAKEKIFEIIKTTNE